MIDSSLVFYTHRQVSRKTEELFFGVRLKRTGEAIEIRQRDSYPKKTADYGLKLSETI